MIFYRYFIVLQLFNLVAAQWCFKRKYVTKSRIQWNNGERLVSKKTFFGNTKYHYEPYLFSSIEYYNDFESTPVCCDGYKKINETYCQPLCEPVSCPPYSQCIRPNICECIKGYEGYSGRPLTILCQHVCLPRCTENSYCSDVNVCTCDEGYVKKSPTQCEPLCHDKCPDNSSCIKPDKCQCNEDYSSRSSNSTSLICDSICSLTCPENGICTGPNTCICPDGFELEKAEGDALKCTPKCIDACPDHSFCSRPNYCECKSGYKKSFYATCDPVCDNACPLYSLCTAPNNCTCKEGYEMLNNICQPVCPIACPVFSSCIKPNTCQCWAGYQLKNSSNYNPYCEPQCQPKCSTFGKCTQPNKCECLDGYEMDEIEICKPVCSKGCSNGLCFSPEVCICNPGYLMGPNGQCEPVCSMPCQNASCVEPEICQCHKGYTMKKGSVSVCEPQCQPECINGLCIDANVCICNEYSEPVPTTDGGYNHSYCRRIDATTSMNAKAMAEETKSTHESSVFSTETSMTLVNLNICQERCQCWEENDILGHLSTGPQCVQICPNSLDRSPCLNVSLCECDVSKLQLHCQDESDSAEDQDTLLYECRDLRQPKDADTSTEESKTIENHNVEYNKENRHEEGGINLWIILAAIVGACLIASLLIGLYIKKNRHGNRIIEYEM